jgi:hypothetical protein
MLEIREPKWMTRATTPHRGTPHDECATVAGNFALDSPPEFD